MSERIQAMERQARERRATDHPAVERRAGTPSPRHCWVADAAGARHPGLLLEWRRTGQAWAGLVAYAMSDAEGGFSLVQEWITSEALRPLD